MLDDFWSSDDTGSDDFESNESNEASEPNESNPDNDDKKSAVIVRKAKKKEEPKEDDNEENSAESNTPEPAGKKQAPRMVRVGEDLIPETQLARQYQKWKGADKKFREAAEARKATQAFFEALQKDPVKVLSDPRLPIDRRKLAETWLGEVIEQENSGEYIDPQSPMGKKLAKLEEQLAEYKQRDIETEESKHKEEFSREVEKRKQEISETLSKAMESTDLSKHPETAAATLREMALYMRSAKDNGLDITPEELVQHVENKRYKEYHTLVNSFDGDQLVSFLGEDLVNKIRKYDLARLVEKKRAERGEIQPKEENDMPARKERQFISPTDARMSW